jgi:hypothetical protein
MVKKSSQRNQQLKKEKAKAKTARKLNSRLNHMTGPLPTEYRETCLSFS